VGVGSGMTAVDRRPLVYGRGRPASSTERRLRDRRSAGDIRGPSQDRYFRHELLTMKADANQLATLHVTQRLRCIDSWMANVFSLRVA